MPRDFSELPRRFRDKVWVRDDGCWIWTACTQANGYGRYGVGAGMHVAAHRFAYEQLIEPIPDGLELDHLCRVRNCVNPAHLEPVTHAENMRRGDRDNYGKKREHCPKGHSYAEHGVRLRKPNGDKNGRRCAECHRQEERARKTRRKSCREI